MQIYGFCLNYLAFATLGNCSHQPPDIRLIIWPPNYILGGHSQCNSLYLVIVVNEV
jgi:hypothetical protein